MVESRTKKSSRNVAVGALSKLITMLFAFATKTLFIKILGVEYNGVYGLFSNILAVLALSELGVGNVLNFALYSSLHNNDIEKVQALVCYFRKIYRAIALAVGCFGIALVPFLNYIINSSLPLRELKAYYILYLINSIVSYFVVYKTTVLVSDQNNYLNSICEIITTVIMYIAQIAYLLIYKNFIGYLVIQVLCTVLKNVSLNYITNKRYSYIKHLDSKMHILLKEDKSKIIENIKSTFLYKIAAVILNHTDNILISILIGTIYVGYYSNYYMIISYITVFVGIFITGITASLGNLNAQNDNDASYNMFIILNLIFSFIGTIIACCLVNCFQPFISLWIGKDNVMGFDWVIVITLNIYLNTIMNPIWMFRESLGLFKQVRYIMLITAGLNIVLSVIFGKVFGVPGILGATFISKLISQYWYEPIILFRRLNRNVKSFYFNQFRQLLIMIFAVIISSFICNMLGSGFFGILLRATISIIIALVCIWFFNRNNEAMAQLFDRVVKPLWRKINKRLLGDNKNVKF